MTKQSLHEIGLEFYEKRTEVSFKKLFDSYYYPLRTYLYKTYGNILPIETIDEIVSETFEKIYSKIHQYKEKWYFTTWTYSIAKYIAIGHIKKLHKHWKYRDEYKYLNNELDEKDNLSDYPFKERLNEVINFCLNENELSKEQKEVFKERFIEGKKINLIANERDKSPNTIKTQLRGIQYKVIKRFGKNAFNI